jgi:CRP-like cAMP-binding protein
MARQGSLRSAQWRPAPSYQSAEERRCELLSHLQRLSYARTRAREQRRDLQRESRPVHSEERLIQAAVKKVQHDFQRQSLRFVQRDEDLRAALTVAVRAFQPRKQMELGHSAITTVTPRMEKQPPHNALTSRPSRFVQVTHRPPPSPAESTGTSAMTSTAPAADIPVATREPTPRVLLDTPTTPMPDAFTPSPPHAATPARPDLGATASMMSQPGMLAPARTPKFSAKRVNSTEHASGQRKYSSWLKKAGSIQSALASEAGKDVANSLVLTGSKRMEGQVTSFTQITQSIAQQKKIVAAMRKDRAFSGTSVVHLSMFCTVAHTRHHTRYGVVYREGADAHTFYVLRRGAVQFSHGVDDSEVEVVRVAEGGEPFCFGTEGLAGTMRRQRTVTCLENTALLHFDTFRDRMSNAGIEALAQRAFASFVEQELKKMPVFFELRPSTLFEIACMFELREVAAAETVIFHHGMPADELCILVKGRIILRATDGLQLAKLEAGTVEDGYPFFGERSILDGGTRDTTAVARTPCRILVLKKSFFPRIVKLMPNLLQRLQEFNTLRKSGADLSRQAAKDGRDSMMIDRKSASYTLNVRSKMRARRQQEEEIDMAGGQVSGPDPRHGAATTVQKHWRGANVRHTR